MDREKIIADFIELLEKQTTDEDRGAHRDGCDEYENATEQQLHEIINRLREEIEGLHLIIEGKDIAIRHRDTLVQSAEFLYNELKQKKEGA